jgi:hypothetical protein
MHQAQTPRRNYCRGCTPDWRTTGVGVRDAAVFICTSVRSVVGAKLAAGQDFEEMTAEQDSSRTKSLNRSPVDLHRSAGRLCLLHGMALVNRP